MSNSRENPGRVDPYRNYRFRLRADDGIAVAGFGKVSAPNRTTDAIKFREGVPSSPAVSPGQTMFQAVTLERGITYDPYLVQWANKVWDYRSELGTGDKLENLRKNLKIEVYKAYSPAAGDDPYSKD